MSRWRRMLRPPTATRAESIAYRVWLSSLIVLALLMIAALTTRRVLPNLGQNATLSEIGYTAMAFVIVYGGAKVTFFASMLVWTWQSRRARRLIQRLDCRLCPRCRYDLTSCPTDGACPECGRSYTEADLCQLWRRTYHLKADAKLESNESK